MLRNLVTDCPFATNRLKSQALEVIARAVLKRENNPDSVRLDGLGITQFNNNDRCREENCVSIITANYFAQARPGGGSRYDSPDKNINPILSYLYGHEMLAQQDSTSVLRSRALSFRPDPLRVQKLGCLSLGAGQRSHHKYSGQTPRKAVNLDSANEVQVFLPRHLSLTWKHSAVISLRSMIGTSRICVLSRSNTSC